MKPDSLQTELHKLHHLIDSLQKEALKDKITAEYFHDILSTQFGGFALLVSIILGVLGLISWGSIIIPFKRKTEQLRSDFNTQIQEQAELFKQREDERTLSFKKVEEEQAALFKKFINDQNLLAAKVNMTLAHSAEDDEDFISACGWSIDSAISFLNIERNEKAIEQLEYIISILKTKKIDFEDLKKYKDKFEACIDTLERFEIEEIRNRLKDIKGLYYPILYSKNNVT